MPKPKTVTFTLRMTPKLRAVIKARAQAVQISESAWVSLAIYRALLAGNISSEELWAALATLTASEHELEEEPTSQLPHPQGDGVSR